VASRKQPHLFLRQHHASVLLRLRHIILQLCAGVFIQRPLVVCFPLHQHRLHAIKLLPQPPHFFSEFVQLFSVGVPLIRHFCFVYERHDITGRLDTKHENKTQEIMVSSRVDTDSVRHKGGGCACDNTTMNTPSTRVCHALQTVTGQGGCSGHATN